MISLRPATPPDTPEIHYLLERAFARPDEAALVDRLRASAVVPLELIAECGSQLVGYVCFSELSVVSPDRCVRAVALAPLAVHPDSQRRGIGGALIKMAIPMLSHAGYEAILVLGLPAYYPRFGFSAELAATLRAPFPPGPQWMALELASGCLDGLDAEVRYPAAFGF